MISLLRGEKSPEASAQRQEQRPCAHSNNNNASVTRRAVGVAPGIKQARCRRRSCNFSPARRAFRFGLIFCRSAAVPGDMSRRPALRGQSGPGREAVFSPLPRLYRRLKGAA